MNKPIKKLRLKKVVKWKGDFLLPCALLCYLVFLLIALWDGDVVMKAIASCVIFVAILYLYLDNCEFLSREVYWEE